MIPYYDHAGITIFHSRWEDVLPTLSGVALILGDPPYGRTQLDWDKVVNWSRFWPVAYQVCTSHALQILFSQQPMTTDLINSNRARYRYELVWPKTMPTGFLDANRRPLRAHESLQVFSARFEGTTYNPQKVRSEPRREHHAIKGAQPQHYGKVNKLNNVNIVTTRHPTDVLPAFSNGHGGKSDHETAKPLDLMCWLVATYSNPGDLVVDPWMGSGPTLEACKRLGRRCIGIELRAAPLVKAVHRLQQEVLVYV